MTFGGLSDVQRRLIRQLHEGMRYRKEVAELIFFHLDDKDFSRGLLARIRARRGWSWETLWGAIRELGTLDPWQRDE